MADLATLGDLTAVLQRTPADLDEQADMEAALARASAYVRRYTRQHIEQVSETITLDGVHGQWLFLPQRPVTAVASVVVDGTTLVADDDYRWSADGTLYRVAATWAAYPRGISVTYTHGYATIPEDVVGVTATLAARQFDNPQGVRSETLDQYSYTYGSDGPQPLDELARHVLDSYRAPVVA